MGAVVQAVKHSVMRTFSVLCVLLVIAGIGWCVYVVMIRKPLPSTATNQRAQAINNTYVNPSTAEIVEAVKNTKESAFEFNLIPPKIKIGGLKISIFK